MNIRILALAAMLLIAPQVHAISGQNIVLGATFVAAAIGARVGMNYVAHRQEKFMAQWTLVQGMMIDADYIYDGKVVNKDQYLLQPSTDEQKQAITDLFGVRGDQLGGVNFSDKAFKQHIREIYKLVYDTKWNTWKKVYGIVGTVIPLTISFVAGVVATHYGCDQKLKNFLKLS